jgi:hypothetical protein
MQVDRPPAPRLRVEIDLPRLTQRIRLDYVSFVVDVEPMFHSVLFQIRYESGNVNGHP